LVVRVAFQFKTIQVKWFGTPKEYDKIDVRSIRFRKKINSNKIMKLKPIKTKKEYEACLDWVDTMFDRKVKPNSTEGETLHVMLLLIKAFEDKNYPIPTPDPLKAIKLKMEERGLKNKDLVSKIGSKGYVSAILSGKKPLTLELAKIFHKELGIPANILLS